MDAAWIELIKAIPWGAVIVILRWLDIKEKTEERKERDANAKDKAEQDRATQITISQSYASAINNLNKVTELSSSSIVTAINDFKAATLDQYRKMGVTQDILDKLANIDKEKGV